MGLTFLWTSVLQGVLRTSMVSVEIGNCSTNPFLMWYESPSCKGKYWMDFLFHASLERKEKPLISVFKAVEVFTYWSTKRNWDWLVSLMVRKITQTLFSKQHACRNQYPVLTVSALWVCSYDGVCCKLSLAHIFNRWHVWISELCSICESVSQST